MKYEPVKDHAERKRISALIERCEKEQTMSDDLIKRSDAIKAVWKPQVKPNELIFDALKTAIESEINNVPSVDIPTWIPCSEEMPEEEEWVGTKLFGTTISDNVLVTFESRGKRYVKPMRFQNGELGGMDKNTMDAIYGEWKAVAWMPLPEPWKGADDE